MSRELKPCGTYAAAQRHYKNSEKLCGPCAEAMRQHVASVRAARGRNDGELTPDRREIRNDLPEFRPYRYRGTGEDILTGHLDDGELEMAS